MPESSFTIDASITELRWKHSRTEDHYGVESDLYVALSEPLGRWPSGTPIHFVIADMVARLVQLENYSRVFGSFTMDSDITDQVFTIDAVIGGTNESTFTIDAEIGNIDTFTIDADIVGRFTIDAFIV